MKEDIIDIEPAPEGELPPPIKEEPPAIVSISLDRNTGLLSLATSLPPGREGLRMALNMLRSVESNIQDQIINMLEEKDGD